MSGASPGDGRATGRTAGGRVARFFRALDSFEETLLAMLLAAMALVSFGQVVARYLFNAGWVAALELTVLLFSWMILLGMSWGIRVGAHLGVDALVRLLPPRAYRGSCVLAALLCLLWAALLLDSDWLTGLLGMRERGGAWVYITRMYEIGIRTEDLRIPRWLAYSVLPLGLVLFALRSIEALWQIVTGRREAIIAGHETGPEAHLSDTPATAREP